MIDEAGKQVQQALDRASSAAVQQGGIQSDLRAAERDLKVMQEQLRAQDRRLQVAVAQQQPTKVVVHCSGPMGGEEIVATLVSHAGVARGSIRSAIRLSSRGGGGDAAAGAAGGEAGGSNGSGGAAAGAAGGSAGGGTGGGGTYARAAAGQPRPAAPGARAGRSTWLLEVASPAVQRAILGRQCRGSLHAAGVALFVERPLTEAEQRQRKAQQSQVRRLRTQGIRTRWRDGAILQQFVDGQWTAVLPGPPPGSPNRQPQRQEQQEQSPAATAANTAA